MRFTKMQALGNDYIYVNCFEEKVEDPAALARRLSRRRFSVGADGVILILPSDRAHARMEVYNADGSRAQMCGNGIRCVGKFVYERQIACYNPLEIETDSGILRLELELEEGRVGRVRVEMGQ
ncbi:MAG: diaminopimelate epimerase, partial [Planctomycetota bacterium]